MRKFGYLDSSSSTTSETLYHDEAITLAIKNMQRYGALNETGTFDNATLKVSSTEMMMCTHNKLYYIRIVEKYFYFSY